MTFRVEFYYLESKTKEVVDEWTTEGFRYPDLTAMDYMDCRDCELNKGEEVIVTLFRDGEARSSILWYENDGEQNYSVIFERSEEE